jgi:hypothetical protein
MIVVQITLIFLFFFCVFRVFRRSFSQQFLMLSRPHSETNENQHQRFAQHIGPPRRGAPGHRR